MVVLHYRRLRVPLGHAWMWYCTLWESSDLNCVDRLLWNPWKIFSWSAKWNNRGSNQSYQNRVAVATGRCLCGRDFSRVPTRDPSMSAGNQCWMINTFWNPLYYSNEKRILSLCFIAVQLARYLFVFALYIFEILGLFYIFEIWSIKNALLLELGKIWWLISAFGACNR